jgi:outer membrane receptor protein involved in Fe transport
MHELNQQETQRNNNHFSKGKVALGIALAFTTVAASPIVYAEDNESKYEKITVTGQKITRTLQETPASIAIFSDAKIDQQNLSEISEVLFETANVHSSTGGNFSIRGIDSFNVSGAGTSALASIYVDGAVLPEGLIRNGFSTWDAEQIEVFRGPQSTLQGRNALAGSIVMTTTAPSHEWGGKYRLQGGENGEREAAIAVGGSLIDDQLAFRVSAEKEDFDGYNYNITRQEHADFKNDALYRLKLLYTPSAIPNLSAQLSFTRATTDKGTTGVNIPESGDPFKQRIITNNDPQRSLFETNMSTVEINYSISDAWDLVSVSTYSEVNSSYDDYDDDAGAEAKGSRFNHEDTETVSQEFRWVYHGEQLSGLIGAYYFDQDITTNYGGITRLSLASLGLSADTLMNNFGLDEATANFAISQYADFDPVVLDQISSTNQHIRSYALFSDFTYEINEQWNIFAGFRWDKEEQDNDDSQNIKIANVDDIPDASVYPAPLSQLIGGINAQLFNYADDANNPIPITEASFDELIPKLGVSYHWTEDITTSFTFQKGYRSGGVGVNSAKSSAYQFDAEITTNYEVALRSYWLEGELMFNANLFYIDWQDQQVSVQLSDNTFDNETKNAGSSTVKGFEVEVFYQMTDTLELFASLGQAKTEFTDFVIVIPSDNTSTVYDLTGRSFADTPELTVNVGATYSSDNGIFASINMNYADRSNADVNPYAQGRKEGDAEFDLQNDARSLVNMKIGYEWDTVGLYLMGKNILDKQYISGAAVGTGRRVVRHDLGAPRQLSLNLQGTF